MSSLAPSEGQMIVDSECESIASKESVETSAFNDRNFLILQNKRLKEELKIYKQQIENLKHENHQLRLSKCQMQANAEVEEEFITNSLLRKIAHLKRNMENMRSEYEQEEEIATSDLRSKLNRLENDKARSEKLFESTRPENPERLNRRIKRLEYQTKEMQINLHQLRVDKGDIQNALEQEQEALLNRLWRNISQADSERLLISQKMDLHSSNTNIPKSFASSKSPSQARKSYSLHPHELRAMNINELTNYVLGLQKELSLIQNRSSYLDPEKYQKLLKECNIKDEKHWLRQKIATDAEEWSKNPSRSSADSHSRESLELFKAPSSKGSNISNNS